MLTRFLKLQDMFLVENSGSTMVINRLSMINNDSTAAWDGIRAAQGAEATVRNSFIEENTNMRVSSHTSLSFLLP
jgi:hypothetical protein